jgi:hypothetical protein
MDGHSLLLHVHVLVTKLLKLVRHLLLLVHALREHLHAPLALGDVEV